ncbi:hypothetical protein A9995_08805 [Erythrobacter sp. QSSC1-22B]|uniref:glycoside hydrolase family 3 C-terminal domain-containing protein n=1 Tax=Erythrobacter sp. QSSC1-22B TaxID=1860125 RepID=UPI0008047C5F|nr:glycoside hydrolase family 3 N-terminal domain-containing protein [Erythrobacter sp. QSSC1-22B]OBX19217.1 hypothetical protein A9995_08805 [Erythrobacter sp. QSSC1-22B]
MTAPGIDRTGRARLVEDMLSYMTLEEKLGQLRVVRLAQGNRTSSGSITEEVLAALRAGQVTAIEGVGDREEALELQTMAVEQSRFGIPLLFSSKGGSATQGLWPQPLAMAASWDDKAIASVARSVAAEGIHRGWNLVATPAVHHLSSAPWDPASSFGTSRHLVEQIARAMIEGLQGNSPSELENVLCLLCYGPLPPAGPEREASERLIRVILRKSDPAGIEELPAIPGELEDGSVSDIHLAYAGIDLGAWRRLARLGAAQSHETDRQELASGMSEGYLSQTMIDEAVRRVLGAKSDLGLFRDPYLKLGATAKRSTNAIFAGRAAIEDLARKSMVLLRNEDELLPLSRDLGRVLVVGTCTESTVGLRKALGEFGIEHSAVSGLALRSEDCAIPFAPIAADGLAIGIACDAATRSDTVLLALRDSDCEPIDGKPMLGLGAAANALMRALFNANRCFALIELTRLPVDLGDLAQQIPARLLAWTGYEGCETALGEVLVGQVNPSGRMPLALLADDRTASLPFGHGLGYSPVTYSDMAVEFGTDRLIAGTSLHNCGEHDCIETVLLYLRSPAWEACAETQLRCFRRVALAAGENRRVQFELGLEELGDIHADGRVIIEPGSYEILLGKDAAHLAGREIELQGPMIRAIEGLSRNARLRSVGF